MHSAQLYLSPHQNVRAEQGHNTSKGLALRMELGNVMAGEGEREGSEGTQGRGKWWYGYQGTSGTLPSETNRQTLPKSPLL